jgi:hypothetical protein
MSGFREGWAVAIRWQCVCVEANGPSRLAAFWTEVLGWRQTQLADPEGNEFCVLRALRPDELDD